MSATKVAILLEMVTLFGGSLVIHRAAEPDWYQTLIRSTRVGVAVTIVAATLFTLDDLGAGEFAATFGALIAIGYLLGAGGTLGPQLAALEASYFGSSATGVPQQKAGLK